MKPSYLGPQPYGYRVTYERINPNNGRVESAVLGCKGTRAHARANAIMKSNFMRLLRLEPLTEEQYTKEFPPGHGQKGRFGLIRA